MSHQSRARLTISPLARSAAAFAVLAVAAGLAGCGSAAEQEESAPAVEIASEDARPGAEGEQESSPAEESAAEAPLGYLTNAGESEMFVSYEHQFSFDPTSIAAVGEGQSHLADLEFVLVDGANESALRGYILHRDDFSSVVDAET